MERSQVQSILAAWRPDLPAKADPEVHAALEAAQNDPVLSAWLDQHSRFQREIMQSLRQCPVPKDLARQILERHKVAPAPFHRRPSHWLALAACLIAVLIGLWAFVPFESGNDFHTFRRRMVRAALREYRMDIETPNLDAIRAFLAQSKAPSDFELTPGLSRLRPVGAGALSWQSGQTAMVCLDGGADGMLYLFIVPQGELRGSTPGQPELTRVNRLATGTWSKSGKTYVLASSASLEAIRKYL